MATVPAEASLAVFPALLAFAGVGLVFDRYAAFVFRRVRGSSSAAYFRAEKHASVAALVVYAFMVFALDLKYYLTFLSLGNTLPALVNIAGLTVFLSLFVLIWGRARRSYELVFSRKYRSLVFIFSNIKANLPIVIPWMVLTLCYDLVAFIPWPGLQQLLASPWGDVLFFGLFVLFVFIFFPPLVRRLWNCKRIEDGPLRDHLLAFCRQQNFSTEIYIWPLFEGRVITAGVMGIIPGLRYILITPALLETMTIEEIDAVMAHEIGHVKRFHLPLYVFLIAGFAIAAGLLAEPLYYMLFSKDSFYSFVGATGLSPEVVRNIVVAVPALFFLLFYFRFVFGYFMRNFERQADLHVFQVLGDSRSIISAFEKIAVLSGNIREEPSWHHFGIGERVDFLQKCEQRPSLIGSHHKKVAAGLVVYILVLVAALFLARGISFEENMAIYEDKYVRADLLYTAAQEENPGHWLFFAGTFFQANNYEKRAVIAFELAMQKDQRQPDLLNNFAWLLLTSNDISLRDPSKGLDFATQAAALKPAGYILDTLATAWWANGFSDRAIETAKQAVFVDPENSGYYQSQIEKFQTITYREDLQSQQQRAGGAAHPGEREG
jgi:Zn-dependent protease with chaperone function